LFKSTNTDLLAAQNLADGLNKRIGDLGIDVTNYTIQNLDLEAEKKLLQG